MVQLVLSTVSSLVLDLCEIVLGAVSSAYYKQARRDTKLTGDIEMELVSLAPTPDSCFRDLSAFPANQEC